MSVRICRASIPLRKEWMSIIQSLITSHEPEACVPLLSARIGESVKLHGYVHKLRRMSGFAFILLRTARSIIQCVHSPEWSVFALDDLPEGACVRLSGDVVADARSSSGYEVRATRAEVLSMPACEPPVVLSGKELLVTFDNRFQLRPLTLRHIKERAVFKLQEGLAHGFSDFMRENDFTEIHTPKIVSASAEGGANLFALDYFGQRAYLAQSPQLYKQMMVGVFERVYEIGPVFRAESHDTSRHLSEFTGLDIEMGFIQGYEDLMQTLTAMLSFAMSRLARMYAPELSLLGVTPPVADAIPAIAFHDAKRLISTKHSRPIADANDLEPEEEQLIGRHFEEETGSAFVFVTHYPSAKRPFYAMDDPTDPSITLSFDLLFRGVEVATGGQRIHDHDEQVKKMRARGMNPALFEHFLMIHKHGMPPHGGFGMGLERLTMMLAGLKNVRFATLFPRDTLRLQP